MGAIQHDGRTPQATLLWQEAERRLCRADPWHYLTAYVKTMDAQSHSVRPFPAFDYLKDLADAWLSEDDVVVEKSRQMTVSWGGMALVAWSVLFQPGSMQFVGSRTMNEVDDGGINSTINSLLGKVRFILEHTPQWLIDPDPRVCFKDANFKQLRITAPHHDGAIVGESTNADMGRGGTYTRAWMDEFASIDHADAAYTSLRQAAKSIWLVSTPKGKNNKFYELRQLAALEGVQSGMRLITLHWSRHPGRDQAWYQRKSVGLTDEQRAQELDISYDRSTAGRVYPEFDPDRHVPRERLAYNPRLPLRASFDFGVNDPTAVLFYQRYEGQRPRLEFVGEYEQRRLPPQMHAQLLKEYVQEVLGFQGNVEDILCCGDPAGLQSSQVTATSVIHAYDTEGWAIETGGIAGVRKVDRILGVRLALKNDTPHMLFCPEKCRKLVLHIQQYHYPEDDERKTQGREKPVHDSHSHMCDALEYAYTFEFGDGAGEMEDIYCVI